MGEEQTGKKGKVYLIGAGPGDIGLLTVKAREVLRSADVIIYDALIGESILSILPSSARLIDAGKRSGNHTIPQENMNDLLLREAEAGNCVVRLKGGDPFVFGRGGEELELLAEHGIPFEIVPGVTSAFAVPAYSGIPVTHREYASSVHVITGHRRKGADFDIDFEALVRTGGTIIFLMGASSLSKLMQGLLEGGMDPETPAAILESGTTARQRKVLSTVADIAQDAAAADIHAPAVTVVGQVAALSKKFAWYDKLPLSGTRILLTRPQELSSEMARILREKGAEVLEIPAIEIVPRISAAGTDTGSAADPEGRREALEIYETVSRAGTYDWLVFTSPTGVRVFMDAYLEHGDIRSLGTVKIAAIGEGSAKALRRYGLIADFIPSVYDGETLARELVPRLSEGMKVLIPRASDGNPELVRELSRVPGLVIDDIAIYDTVYKKPGAVDERALLEEGGIDYAVFTSASTVRGFRAAVGDMDFTNIKAVCIGRRTGDVAEALGMKTFISEKATVHSLVEKVEELAARSKVRGGSRGTNENGDELK